MTPQHAGARRPAYPPKSFKSLTPPTSGNTAAPSLSPIRQATGPSFPSPSGHWPRPLPAVRSLVPPSPVRQTRGSVQFPTPPCPPATPSLSRSASGPAHLPAPPRPSLPGGPRFLAGGPCLSLGFSSPPRRNCAGCEAPATQKQSGAGGAAGLCSCAMAASAWCCLRCCRDGGTGHIPLKEMPAVQLDTQHMGKGLSTEPNGPWGRRAGERGPRDHAAARTPCGLAACGHRARGRARVRGRWTPSPPEQSGVPR